MSINELGLSYLYLADSNNIIYKYSGFTLFYDV